MNRAGSGINTTMAAAVFHGDERITIERIPLPRVGEGEVLMRVGKTGPVWVGFQAVAQGLGIYRGP